LHQQWVLNTQLANAKVQWEVVNRHTTKTQVDILVQILLYLWVDWIIGVLISDRLTNIGFGDDWSYLLLRFKIEICCWVTLLGLLLFTREIRVLLRLGLGPSAFLVWADIITLLFLRLDDILIDQVV